MAARVKLREISDEEGNRLLADRALRQPARS